MTGYKNVRRAFSLTFVHRQASVGVAANNLGAIMLMEFN